MDSDNTGETPRWEVPAPEPVYRQAAPPAPSQPQYQGPPVQVQLPPQPEAPKRGGGCLKVVLGVTVFFTLLAVAAVVGIMWLSASWSEAHKPVPPDRFNFTVSNCEMKEDNTALVAGTFTNLTGETRSFRGVAGVGFNGARWGTGTLKVDALPYKQRAFVSTVVRLDATPGFDGELACEANEWNFN